MVKILVTGATGNVGSQVAKQLATAGYNFRLGVRSVSKAPALPGAEPVEFDFNRTETLEKAMTGVDTVFLLTPMTHNQADEAIQAINAAGDAGVKRLVRLSTIGAEMEPGIFLGREHRRVEMFLESSDLSYTILRANYFMQNNLNFAGSIKTQSAFFAPMGEGRLGMIDARDIAAVAVKTLIEEGHDGKTYELTGSEIITNQQVAETLSSVLGRKISYTDVTPEAARQTLSGDGMPDWMVDALLELYAAIKTGFADRLTNTVEERTVRKPITLDQFVMDHIDAFR